jgi:hypothetical protein
MTSKDIWTSLAYKAIEGFCSNSNEFDLDDFGIYRDDSRGHPGVIIDINEHKTFTDKEFFELIANIKKKGFDHINIFNGGESINILAWMVKTNVK